MSFSRWSSLFNDELRSLVALLSNVDALGEVVGVYSHTVEVEVLNGSVNVDSGVVDATCGFLMAEAVETGLGLIEECGAEADVCAIYTAGEYNENLLVIGSVLDAFQSKAGASGDFGQLAESEVADNPLVADLG